MLTVLTPADTYDLTTLETVKTEMEITGTTDDTFIAGLIRQASADVASYCRRVLALEEVRETFRPVSRIRSRCEPANLWLRRIPVATLDSVTEDGNLLVEGTDFELDPAEGKLVRIGGGIWCGGFAWGSEVVVEYSGGYELLPDLPYDIERATIDLVKRRYYARARDPALRGEKILDVIDSQYTSDASEPTIRGLPKSLAERLNDYVSVTA